MNKTQQSQDNINKILMQKCHNYQIGNCTYKHKDCSECDDRWYSEADTGRFAEKGR